MFPAENAHKCGSGLWECPGGSAPERQRRGVKCEASDSRVTLVLPADCRAVSVRVLWGCDGE